MDVGHTRRKIMEEKVTLISRRWSILLLLSVFLVGNALAQRLDGTLRGTVLDPSGAVVVNAKVTATNEATGVVSTTNTTSAGTYVFPNLLPGMYTVVVEAQGFQAYTRKNVTVNANQIATVDPRLGVSGSEQTVEVVAGAEVVQTNESQIGSTFNERVIADVPIASLGGSPLELSTLVPNTTTLIGGTTGDGGSVGGLRARANGFTIDGADNNDISVTGSSAPVIQDAIEEFNILTNQFSAENGFAAGGQFNLITKSGTNNFHGEAHWYNRNRFFNALDNLEKSAGLTEAPRNDFNRAGGSLGGPIVKNRLFFFGAYEYQTQGLAANGIPVGAPTAEGLTLLNNMAANDAVRNILSQFPAAPAADAAPITVNETSIPIGNLTIIAPNFNVSHSVQGNMDFNATERHQLRGRFLYTRFRAPNPNLVMPLPQFDGEQPVDYHTGILSHAWTVSDKAVNEFRLSFNRNINAFTVPEQFADFPQVIIGGLSNFSLGPEENSPQSGFQNTYQVQNNFTYSSGRHTWKFGGEWRRWITSSDFLPRSRGEWEYADLEELINDELPSIVTLRNVGSGRFDGNMHGLYFFVQDDFKVTPRLTLNLGLRYEWTGNPVDVKKQELNAIASTPGLFEFREPKTDRNNFAPRVGFAWDPTGSGKWAIRGGAGLSYYNTFQNLALLNLPPQLQSEQNEQVTCSGLAGTPPAWCATGQGFLANGGLLRTLLVPTTREEAMANTSSIITDQLQPQVYTWSLGVQRELYKNTSIELRYLGTRSLRLPVQTQLNTISVFERAPQLGSMPVYFSESEVPANVPLNAASYLDFLNAQNLRYGDLNTNTGYLNVVTGFPGLGSSTYHGGSVDFIQRFMRGLYLRTNYTFAKTRDNSSNELFSSRVNPRRPQSAYDLAAEWSRSAMDIRHKFALSWVYDLPRWETGSFLDKIVQGWQFNGSYIAQSGQPVTALAGVDMNGNFDAAGDRAIVNPNGQGLTGTSVNYVLRNPATGATSICSGGAACFTGPGGEDLSGNIVGYVAANPNARFISADLGARATAGRNTITSPGLNLWNMALYKTTSITEDVSFQIRWETYNTFNHRNFSLAAPTVFSVLDPENALSTAYADVRDPRFLDPKQFSGGSRNMQVGIKLIW